jgi:tripartite-type tricarboxylate transporter receptor subunit TctC
MRLAALLVFAFLTGTACAQAYPSKAVKVVVPYPAGSTPDTIGRTLAERLQKALGQPFIVETPERDLAPISLLATAPQLLVVRPQLNVAGFREFVEHVRRAPDKLSYASLQSGGAAAYPGGKNGAPRGDRAPAQPAGAGSAQRGGTRPAAA